MKLTNKITNTVFLMNRMWGIKFLFEFNSKNGLISVPYLMSLCDSGN